MAPAIEVRDVWKLYHFGRLGYGSLRHDLQSWWARLRGREDPNRSVVAREPAAGRAGAEGEEFWALRDVSLSIEPGEVVGIVGRNGAGKSTLLKILSRVTAPTRGEARLRGRVASLLEVGTGFHPELTGRENVYLNGAILGMRRAEVSRKMDEIVDFSGIAEFLGTPVKRYSTGMYLRLAFSVAAHLEAEILLVDEILAVGDSEFQRRCLGRMGDVARGGKTVLFVSHNLGAVEQLCGSVLWLEGGAVVDHSSDVERVLERYLARGHDGAALANHAELPVAAGIQVNWFGLVDGQGRPVRAPSRRDQPLRVRVGLDVREEDPSLNLGFALYEATGTLLFWSLTTDLREEEWPTLALGQTTLEAEIAPRLLNEGRYRMELIVSRHQREWISQPGVDAPGFEFEIAGGLSDSPNWTSKRPGAFAPVLTWRRIEVAGAPGASDRATSG